MSKFILDINNRDYTEWNFISVEETKSSESTLQSPKFSPIDLKLFHKDVIDSEGKVISSFYRYNENICGVLLTSEKTYGRSIKDKLLFKCIPDDEHLPCFLIPYEEKNIGFSKTKMNKYITFRIHEWKDKHPSGILTNNFGNVDNIEACIEYQLTCNNLNDSTKQLSIIGFRALRLKTLSPIPFYINDNPIEDRRLYSVFSIDPIGCTDIDDAIGITTKYNEQIISIYITNVPIIVTKVANAHWPGTTQKLILNGLAQSQYFPKKIMKVILFNS